MCGDCRGGTQGIHVRLCAKKTEGAIETTRHTSVFPQLDDSFLLAGVKNRMAHPDDAGKEPVKPRWEEWSRVKGQRQHADRFPLMRIMHVEASAPSSETHPQRGCDSTALMLNYSYGGLCVLMSWRPQVHQVLQLHMLHSMPLGIVPTHGDVRWMRTLPFGDETWTHVVGIKFIR